MGTDGARVIRLPYSGPFPFFIKKKLRKHSGVYEILKNFSPDVVVFHGLCGWELLTVAKYKRDHPQVRLYADSHEDANNSARTFFSKHVLHRMYYRPIIHRSLSAVEKVLCISMDTIEFCRNFYEIPQPFLEFFPLGGVVLDNAEYHRIRHSEREKFGIEENDIVFIQSGKFDERKKLLDSLLAFTKTQHTKCKFFIAGQMSSDIKKKVQVLIDSDHRIHYVGWLPSDELYNLLCASDVYVQPGTQSATMQMSLCARCVVILDDVPSHYPFVEGNGWLLGEKYTLSAVFNEIENNPELIKAKSLKSYEIASRLLDYESMAKRLLQ